MIELTTPIPELSTKELNLHLAQGAVLFDECPTGRVGADARLAISDVVDALMAEKRYRNASPN